MILAVHTTPANAHDSEGLVSLIKKVRVQHREEVLVGKWYKSKANDEFLAARRSRSRIMHKGYRNRPISALRLRRTARSVASVGWWNGPWEHKAMVWLGEYAIEGTGKVHAEHVMEATAHNLKRLPWIYASMS